MDYIIREMRSEEYCLLSDFLYEAIYIPDGIEPPPKSVIDCPELQEYIHCKSNRCISAGGRVSGGWGLRGKLVSGASGRVCSPGTLR